MNTKKNSILAICFTFFLIQISAQYDIATLNLPPHDENNAIIVSLHLSTESLKDSGTFRFTNVEYIGQRDWKSEWIKPQNGYINLQVPATSQVYINFDDLLTKKRYGVWLAEPGDQIVVTSSESRLSFSGKGSEKFRLQYQLDTLLSGIPKPTNPKDYITNSLADYFEWHNYFKKIESLTMSIIDSYRGKISNSAFDIIKANLLDQLIDDRNDKFNSFRIYAKENQIPFETVCAIYDSTFDKPTEKIFNFVSTVKMGNWSRVRNKIARQYSFDPSKFPPDADIVLYVFNEGQKVYNGKLREQFNIMYLPSIMLELGFTPQIQQLLNQYYANSTYPEYKQFMEEQELKIRERLNNGNAPEFIVSDFKGNIVTKKEITNKIAILHFWVSDSPTSIQTAQVLQNVKQRFKNDSDVVFFNISVDPSKEQWFKTISGNPSAFGNQDNYYAGLESSDPDMAKRYAAINFPAIYVIQPEGKTIKTNARINLLNDNGKALTELIQKQLAYPKDGPYLMHDESSSTLLYVNGNSITRKTFNPAEGNQLSVYTDLNEVFTVSLKRKLSDEPSIFPAPSKLLALSDIEGNFEALRKLLQANKVIDQNFNWIFGDGHLVFLGDMFDRGMQVTECLWLLYSLEEKAKSAGGYVHFILGNHEIMNLQGKHKYVTKKYLQNASKIGRSLTELYNEQSELGKWLRTKNIIESIGDLLFVHGGISPSVSRMPLTIPEINNLARPYYAKEIDSTNQYLVILFDNHKRGNENNYPSPFWFRGYYGDIDNLKEIPTIQQVDSSLVKYGVHRIITGHTIISEGITTHYGGRVINVDTHHAGGKSEALLIKGNQYYRANLEGVLLPLF